MVLATGDAHDKSLEEGTPNREGTDDNVSRSQGSEQDSSVNVSSGQGTESSTSAPQLPSAEQKDPGTIVDTVTRLLEAQRHMMEVQVQALASQSVPPLRKFTGEDINTDEGSIDQWLEQFEERADVTGWDKEQKLFQLKAHLEKTARHAVRMLPEKKKRVMRSWSLHYRSVFAH